MESHFKYCEFYISLQLHPSLELSRLLFLIPAYFMFGFSLFRYLIYITSPEPFYSLNPCIWAAYMSSERPCKEVARKLVRQRALYMSWL